MLTVTVSDNKVVDSFNELSASLQPAIVTESVVPFLTAVQAEARRSHRYNRQTGRLERSVKISTDKDGGSVYIDEATANYGKYIHEGTRKWHSDPFLTDAFDNNQRNLDAAIDRSVDGVIKKAGL